VSELRSLVVRRCLEVVDGACQKISDLLEASCVHQKELEEHADMVVGFAEKKQVGALLC
jgi:hypothetical protein